MCHILYRLCLFIDSYFKPMYLLLKHTHIDIYNASKRWKKMSGRENVGSWDIRKIKGTKCVCRNDNQEQKWSLLG